jgi:hypothetical protein
MLISPHCSRVACDQRHIENISKISNPQEKINYIEEKKKLL